MQRDSATKPKRSFKDKLGSASFQLSTTTTSDACPVAVCNETGFCTLIFPYETCLSSWTWGFTEFSTQRMREGEAEFWGFNQKMYTKFLFRVRREEEGRILPSTSQHEKRKKSKKFIYISRRNSTRVMRAWFGQRLATQNGFELSSFESFRRRSFESFSEKLLSLICESFWLQQTSLNFSMSPRQHLMFNSNPILSRLCLLREE